MLNNVMWLDNNVQTVLFNILNNLFDISDVLTKPLGGVINGVVNRLKLKS